MNSYNPVKYTYINHTPTTIAKFRKDPEIGGRTDMHDLQIFFDKIAATPKIVKRKDQLELWAPCTFIARRRKSDVLGVHCMVYDVDDGLEFAAHEQFKKYDYIAHTSYSHTKELHKYRIILPLKKSIPPEDWKHAWRYGSEMFRLYTKASTDPACKDSSRAYYVGGTTADKIDEYKAVLNNTGVRFNLDYSIPPPTKKRSKGKFKTFNQEEFTNYNNAVPEADERRQIASYVGADIIDNTARKITCPSCGRKSAWFYIDVSGPLLKGRCNHLNSCGWAGSIREL